MTLQAPIIVETAETVDAAVIWLHGLGADGHDFAPVVPQFNLPNTLGVRFIFPHAPMRAITINGGMPMRAWFNMTAISESAAIDHQGLSESTDVINELIRQQHQKGIPDNKIVLAGFSQGGALALHAALHYPKQLAGVIALSTYIPTGAEITQSILPSNNSTPIFMAHGQSDTLVPYSLGEKSYRMLHKIGLNISWHTYPMAHSVCNDEIDDIGEWLADVLG